MSYSKIKKSITNQKNSATRISMILCIYLLHYKPDQIKATISKFEIDKLVSKYREETDIVKMVEQIYYDNDDYNWIEESTRLHKFIDSNIRIIIGSTPSNQFMPNLLSIQGYTNREKTIGLIDYYSLAIIKTSLNKYDLNLYLKGLWENFTKNDSAFDWLNDENSNKTRAYLWKYLKTKHSDFIYRCKEFQNHDELMIFFDQLLITPEQKIKILKNVKILWDKDIKKLDSKKSQCNYYLPTSTKIAIIKLAEKYDYKPSEMVQIILDSEVKDNYHIKRRLIISKGMLDSQSHDTDPKEKLSSKPEENIKFPPLPEL